MSKLSSRVVATNLSFWRWCAED